MRRGRPEDVASSIVVQNVNVSTQGDYANGVQADSGGVTTISGGSVGTSGANAYGLYATGVGSSIATSSGTTIATTGANANAVDVDSAAPKPMSGGTIATASRVSTSSRMEAVRRSRRRASTRPPPSATGRPCRPIRGPRYLVRRFYPHDRRLCPQRARDSRLVSHPHRHDDHRERQRNASAVGQRRRVIDHRHRAYNQFERND